MREGVSNVHIYYIPKTYIREYDGNQIWIDASSGLVRSKFERKNEPSVEELRAMTTEAPPHGKIEPQAQLNEETDTITLETDIDLKQNNVEKKTEGA